MADDTTGLNLLPCPFCGKSEFICDLRTIPRTRRPKNQPVTQYSSYRCAVECGHCGVVGPERIYDDAEASRDAAAFEWNNRAPINDRAFALVNKLIKTAYDALASRETE